MNSRASSQSSDSDLEGLEHLLSYLYSNLSSPDPSLPGRQVIPTYLKKLDKQWRGGWSWQWPMLIAGPPDAGKTLFAYQLLASTLLSCLSPWRILSFNLKGDFQPESILPILSSRSKRKGRGFLGRLDHVSLLSEKSVWFSFQMMSERDNLCLFFIDAWNHRFPEYQNSVWWRDLAKLAQMKQMAFLMTVRGELESLLAAHPFASIPYFVYITKKKHCYHRIRVWQNSSRTKIYDQVVRFTGYFQEPRPPSTRSKRD